MSDTNQLATRGGGAADENIDNNDRIIASIQSKRESFIAQLTPEGKLPSSAEDRAVLLALMQGAATTAIANKKIKVDEKAAVSQTQLVASMVEAARIAQATASATLRTMNRATTLEVPAVEVKLVKGHTDIGTRPVSTSAVALGSDDIFTEQ